jgi:hypothetical protein
MKKRNSLCIPVILLILVVALSGCATYGHQNFYTQIAPFKYPPVNNVAIFEYVNVDIQEIYNILYSDFLIIGKSGFNGQYEKPGSSADFAKSIGADVFITSSQFAETRTSFVPVVTPTVTTVTGTVGTQSVYGTATTFNTNVIPVTVHRYNQDGMYLKNVNKVVPLWEKKKPDYKNTGNHDLQGNWQNEIYDMELYLSGTQMVAFITKNKEPRVNWKNGDLKMIFNPETGAGVYMMGDRTPRPAAIALNKFGHLEIKIIGTKEQFSYARF